ncbi:hypothetical protein D4764_11G0010110 [Takifugu flavidus]|uniref:Uncharacterized protein n=1 Tax=Takifugu flavidus TaxID=433684 RepID=A0A5C6PKV6_9TELE|nr:hypothetical protein D4764_11G0010110 [Takifugu flavidus]
MSFLGRVDMRKRSEQRWLGHLFQMPPVHLPREVFEACPTGIEPHQRLGKNRRDYVSQLA